MEWKPFVNSLRLLLHEYESNLNFDYQMSRQIKIFHMSIIVYLTIKAYIYLKYSKLYANPGKGRIEI